MNFLQKFGCRVYQKTMYVASCFLPWRQPKVLDKIGGLQGLGNFVKDNNLGNVLVVTGNTVKTLQPFAQMIKSFDEAGAKYTVFSNVVANPTIDNVEAGVQVYKENDCACIVAFGGGSPMDCAKAIGARIVCPNKPVQKMRGLLKIRKKLPPFIAVPTTAGSGSETTLAAVISDATTHEKYALNDPSLIPHYVVFEPRLLVGLPKHILATTGMDALTHAIEAYLGKANCYITREASIRAIKLIFEFLPKAYNDDEDIDSRQIMQIASYFAGVSFTRAYVGYVHAIAHQLGGVYGTPHGLANAVILPYVLDYYGKSIDKKLQELATYIGVADKSKSVEENAKLFMKALRELGEKLNIPTKIKGIKDEDIPLMAERAYKEANPLYPVPKFMGKQELEDMYHTIKERENEA